MPLSDIPEKLRLKFSRIVERVRAFFHDGKKPVYAALAVGLLCLSLLLFVLLSERQKIGERFAVPEDDGILTRFTRVHPRSPLAPAVRAFQNGYPAKAINLFRKLLQRPGIRSVERQKIYNYLAYLYLSMGRRADATAAFQASIRAVSDNAPALYGLGRIAQLERRFSDAIKYYKESLSVSRHFRKSYWRIGQVYLALKKPDDAIPSLVACLRYKDDPRVRYELGLAYLQLTRDSAAEIAFKRVLDLSSNKVLLAYACARLGDIFEKKSEIRRALQYYSLAVQYYPKKFAFQYNFGLLLMKANEREKALAIFKRLLPHAPSGNTAALARTLGELHYDRKDFKNALKYYQISLKNKDDLDVVAVVADLLYLHQRYREALLYYDKIIRDFPGTQQAAAAMINAGNIHLLQDSHQDALLYYQKAGKADPRNPRLWYNIGIVYWRLNLLRKAENAFLNAYRLDPLYGSALQSAATVILEQGDARRALNLYLNTIAAKGQSVSSWMYLNAGSLFRKLREFDNARRFILQAVQSATKTDRKAKALLELARVYLDSGKPSAVYPTIKKLFGIQPESAAGHYLFALALIKEGRDRDASDSLSAALMHKMDQSLKVEVLFQLGNVFYKRGNFSAALDRYKQVLDIKPTHSGAQYNAAQCVKRLRQ